MLGKLRSFSKGKLAAVLVAIIIIPFVFWGMGSVFSGGNTNSIAKINSYNVSTKDFSEIFFKKVLFLRPTISISSIIGFSKTSIFKKPKRNADHFFLCGGSNLEQFVNFYMIF